MSRAAGSRTVRSVLEHRAASTPDGIFLIYDDLAGGVLRLSYGDFDAQVNRTAHLLRGLGIEAGDAINLHMANRPEFLFLWFAAAKIGAIVMPTNPLSVAGELEYLIGHSNSRVIFTTPDLLAVAAQAGRGCANVRAIVVCGASGSGEEAGDGALLFDHLLDGQPVDPPPGDPEALGEVAILYTSGTTARPKGVLVTNANYIYAGETVANAIRLSSGDRHLVVMPLFHGNAQYYSTMSALVAGASLVLLPRFSASAFFDRAIAHGCTVSSLFAAPIRMLLAQPPRPELRRNRLRVVMFAQSVREAQLTEWHDRFGAPLLQLYGMTETMGPPLMNPIDDIRSMSIGRPVVQYEVALVDGDGQPVPPGDVGQILVRGEAGGTVMKGYHLDSDATAAAIRGGWLWTGDTARQDRDGYFHFVDRRADMIKRAGENIAASEVEGVIRDHPDVFDCAVVGVPDPVRDEAIKAFVVLTPGSTADVAAIVDWCRRRLSPFKVPQMVELLPALPRTAVGKIQKHVLRAM